MTQQIQQEKNMMEQPMMSMQFSRTCTYYSLLYYLAFCEFSTTQIPFRNDKEKQVLQCHTIYRAHLTIHLVNSIDPSFMETIRSTCHNNKICGVWIRRRIWQGVFYINTAGSRHLLKWVLFT